MISNTDAVRIIDSKREDAVIIPTMNAGNVRFGLPSVTSNQPLDLPISGGDGEGPAMWAWGWRWRAPSARCLCWTGTAAC